MPQTGTPSVFEPFPYTYNLLAGAQRWRNALGRIRDLQPAGSASQYGIDVLVIGDSTGTYGNIYESWPHLLKVLLQERYNRSGVVGGFGFMPFNTNSLDSNGLSTSTNDWTIWNAYTVTCSAANATAGATYTNNGRTFTVITTIAGATTLLLNGSAAPSASGTLTKASGTGDATITFSSFASTTVWNAVHNTAGREGTGLFETKISTPGANGKIWRYFDPTTTAGVLQRQGITDWEYVGLSFTGGVAAQNVYLDSATSNGPITPTNLVNMIATGKWGEHWTRQTGLTATQHYTLQLAGHEVTDQTWANGVILYNGDYNEGIRLHNLSSVGSDTGEWNDTGQGQRAQQIQANFDQFCTGANGGARNGKLVLINTMLNDCGITSGNITPATYQSNLQAIITAVVAEPSKPCVGLIVQRPWDLTVSNPTQLALYTQYRTACYALAAANPQTVFVIDLWSLLTDTINTYQFVMSGVTTAPTAGAVYTDSNSNTYTCVGSNSGKTGTAMTMTGGTPPASGTLTKSSGTGDASITYSSVIAPAPNGYANYGINAAGGAMFNRGWYNDGTHNLNLGNLTEAWQIFSVLTWGNS